MAGQAYHAGVLSALADSGWDPGSAEVIVGTSAGSITAALLRAGVAPSAMASGSYRSMQGAGRAAAPEAAEMAAAAALVTGATSGRASVGGQLSRLVPAGRTSPGGIITTVRRVAGDRWPGRATWICAVRRSDGRRIVFGREGAPEVPQSLAVAASCAIPGFFTPVTIDGQAYVDGGAHSPTNLDLLAGLGLDALVVSSPMSVSRTGIGRRLDLPVRMVFRATLAREVRAARRAGTPVLTLQPTDEDLQAMGLNAMDPRPWAQVVRSARASTRRRLEDPAVGRLLTG